VSERLRTVSPVDGRVLVERPLLSEGELARVLERARRAQAAWRAVPIAERVAVCQRFVAVMEARRHVLAEEITRQMGRPIAQSPGEVGGLAERAGYMSEIAESSLADIPAAPKPGFERFVRREPVGLVLTVAPWNYPYLTAVNTVVPAILAGNAVLLRHSSQTPLCSERFAEGFEEAGLPDGLCQAIHLGHAATERLIGSGGVDFVAFTGSVEGGRAVEQAAAGRFLGLGLELGGKDPAYVRADADLPHAVEALADGAFFNAGQSCCGIERIYVARAVYPEFVEALVAEVEKLRLGDPMDPATTLGPMVRASAAAFVRGQVAEAQAAGARALISADAYAADEPGSAYLAPQVLVDVDHRMRVMREESFGPVVGVMPVDDDDEAVALMNDSPFGLTAAVFTRDREAALALGGRVHTGTWFMNRCAYLDPALAWTGVKDSGRGCTLSPLGFHQLTHPKSYHLRS